MISAWIILFKFNLCEVVLSSFNVVFLFSVDPPSAGICYAIAGLVSGGTIQGNCTLSRLYTSIIPTAYNNILLPYTVPYVLVCSCG